MHGLRVGVVELAECRAHGRLVSESRAMASGIFLLLHRHPHHLAPSPAHLRAFKKLRLRAHSDFINFMVTAINKIDQKIGLIKALNQHSKPLRRYPLVT